LNKKRDNSVSYGTEPIKGTKQRYKEVPSMAEKDLKSNLDFVIQNKNHLLKEYRNKYILVFEKEVVGSFDTYEKAAEEGVRVYGMDANFLVYQVLDNDPLNFVMEAML
jgi:hypothetical protein